MVEGSVKEPFAFTLFLLSATEHLSLSYAVNFDTQQNIKMSPYLDRVVKRLDVPLQERGILTLVSDPRNYVGSYRGLIYQINNLSQQAQKQREFA